MSMVCLPRIEMPFEGSAWTMAAEGQRKTLKVMASRGILSAEKTLSLRKLMWTGSGRR